MKEQWKDVVGLEGVYQVSSSGRVRRTGKSKKAVVGRCVTPGWTKKGYRVVWLSNKCRKVTAPVHTLVAVAFIGPRPPGAQVNHKNGIKHDNRLSNLEWCTPSENLLHSYHVLGNIVNRPRGKGHASAKLTESAVREIRACKAVHSRWGVKPTPLQAIGKKYNVSQTTIIAIRSRKAWKHVV